MDAGSRTRRYPLRLGSRTTFIPSLRTPFQKNPSSRDYGDRFIPNRSAMDFDAARCLVTEPRKEKDNAALPLPSKEAYKTLLAETLGLDRTRILSFKNKPCPPPKDIFQESWFGADPPLRPRPTKPKRCISEEKILDAPEIVDDFYLNLLDWGSRNILSIALGDTVHLWDASNGSISELVTVDEELGPITSVSWAPDGKHIAVGLNSSDVQLWDSCSNRLLRTFRGGHQARVGSLSWNNNNILTTGGMDGKIVNNDVRMEPHIVGTYRGHHDQICGLKWSGSGQQLASGGNDNLVHIWDLSMSSSSRPRDNQNQWLHQFANHSGAVKALAWCPFQSNLLASGGGESDRCIKFFNTHTGVCLNSVNTGSQVCGLLWGKNERELLSSHGSTENQLTLWKYPSMRRQTELRGHTDRVLFMTQSPSGSMVASAAADETLRFWKVFGEPEVSVRPFADVNLIR